MSTIQMPVEETARAALGDDIPPQPSPPRRPEVRRKVSGLRRTDVLAIVGAALAALSLTSLLFTQLMPLSGLLGFVVVAYLLFLCLYALLVSFDESGPIVKDRIAQVTVQSFAFLMLLALVVVVVFTLVKGWKALVHWNFFTQDMVQAGPLDPLDVGGVVHAIVGTLIQITIALMITVPLGLTCAVFLNEIPGRFSRFVRTIVEAMTALPSIVAGLFIYATWILVLGFDKSGLAAALAISVMMLPIIIRAADVVLRLVPGALKEAALATGASQWRTVWHVTLPTARSGLATAVILGTARGIGETSPVLITAGYTAAFNANPLEGPMVSLPLATFQLIKSPEADYVSRGFGAAAVLLTLVLILFVIARIIGGRGPGQLTKRQERKRVRASARDVDRYAARREPAFQPATQPSSGVRLIQEPPPPEPTSLPGDDDNRNG